MLIPHGLASCFLICPGGWYGEMRSTQTLKLLCSQDLESCSFLLRLAKKVLRNAVLLPSTNYWCLMKNSIYLTLNEIVSHQEKINMRRSQGLNFRFDLKKKMEIFSENGSPVLTFCN